MAGEDSLWEDGASVFRPSYSATWLYCEDALVAGLTGGEDHAGIDAAVGTVFHDLMAEWQRAGRPDYRLHTINEIVNPYYSESFKVIIDEDMFSYGEECLRYVEQFDGERLVEYRVDISDITPISDQGGTADDLFLAPKKLVVVDWKYGIGVQVFANWNTQLLLYAWGAFQEFDWIYGFETIEVHIAQPRLYHWDYMVLTRRELTEWAAWAKERAYAAWRGNKNRTRTPGPKQCLWCKVKHDCGALEALREELADLSFPVDEEELNQMSAGKKPYENKVETTFTRTQIAKLSPDTRLPSAMELSTAQLAHIFRYRKLMERWFAEIQEELLTRASHGDETPGWTVVEGRTRRKWIDEDAMANKLFAMGFEEDEIYVKKLVSPNQSTKLLRAAGIRGKALDEYLRIQVDKPIGKPTLAPDGDNRLSLPVITDPFDEEEEDEAAL